MRIAICDDTVDEINAIKNIIDSYKSDFEITYDCFTNGVEFLSKVSLGEFYDLIFLDGPKGQYLKYYPILQMRPK